MLIKINYHLFVNNVFPHLSERLLIVRFQNLTGIPPRANLLARRLVNGYRWKVGRLFEDDLGDILAKKSIGLVPMHDNHALLAHQYLLYYKWTNYNLERNSEITSKG